MTITASRPLSDLMDFDHVIQVHLDGSVTDADGVWAPELHVGTLDEWAYIEGQPKGWRLMRGYSAQYGYPGPLMHPSEFIGGGMERDILAQPGLYVALVNYVTTGDEDCDDCTDDDGPCDSHGIDGWAVAYIPGEE